MIRTLAVIDIGSNSIKLLVANERVTVYEDLIGYRLSAGLGNGRKLVLSENTISGAVKIISKLVNEAKTAAATEIYLVATSAIREAQNQKDFCARVEAETHLPVHVLSGEQEALAIARGVRTDPLIQGMTEFSLFDTGGGSLECIHYKEPKILYAESFPLGIVRLSEKFIKTPNDPIPDNEIQAIIDHVEGSLKHGFPHRGIPLIATGGGVTTARFIFKKDAILHREALENLLHSLCKLTSKERIKIFNIPEFRADIMPAALAITLAVMDKAGADEVIHTYCSLRFGIADLVLASPPDIHLKLEDLL